ncbi:MAG: hypothetical protein JWN20_308 [Jatrophihabitantaceae bacterium]|nr:hypothetical protein [Jatrophihabitantaceae bacterium]
MLLVLVLRLAAPVQRYLAHREAIAAAQKLQSETQQRVDELTKLSEQWKDPAYIEQQARIRLQYVMPGDTVYQVVPGGAASSGPASTTAPDPTTQLPGDSWNERLWATVEAADATP